MIRIGSHNVGPGLPVYCVAEAGINPCGSLDYAKRLMDVAAAAGCQAVKFQKRTIETVFSPEELARPLPPEAPFATRGDYVRAREFSIEAHWELSVYAASVGLDYASSAFDVAALVDVELCQPAFHKVASAMVTDHALLRAIRSTGRPVIMSTGMSTIDEIDAALEVLRPSPVALLHCVSAYPCPEEQLNLRITSTLIERYGDRHVVGYSGHETGIAATLCAVVLGACIVERHVTLDRSAWGSDHAASLEPDGLRRLVRDIRMYERARGDGVKRVLECELPVRARLRRTA